MNNREHDTTFEQLGTMGARYDKNGDVAQAARFYRMAGQEAAAQYANDAAVNYFSLALNLTADAQVKERFALLLARESVYALQGKQKASKKDLSSLEFLANILNDDASRAETGVRRAHHHLQTSQFDLAVSTAQMAARMARIGGDGRIEAEAYLTWGTALIRQGSYAWAQTQLVKALHLAQGAKKRQLEADCIRTIGLLYMNQSDLVQARFSYDSALEIYTELGDSRGRAMTLNNLAHIAYNRKKFNEAQAYWDEALEAYKAVGDRPALAMVTGNLGAMYMDIGDYDQAKMYSEEALAISQDVQSLMGQSMALLNLALLNHYQGDQDTAYELSQTVLQFGQQMNNRRVQGYAFIPMGHALLALNKPVKAQESYWQSLAIWDELGQHNLMVEQRAGLARSMMAQKQLVEAKEQVKIIVSFLDQNEALEGVESPFRVYLTCYQVLQANQDGRAKEILETAHTLLQAKAAEITDKKKRQAYLQNIEAHRLIIEAFSES